MKNDSTTYILLLRGINVSGKNSIKMEDLKNTIDQTIHTNCKTYIQSGNVIFQLKKSATLNLENKINECLFDLFNTPIPFVLLTIETLNELINNNPFKTSPIAMLHVTICKEQPSNEVPLPSFLPDEATCIGNHIYLRCPNGYGKTKYTNLFFEKKFNTISTTRNWKTILTLQQLANE
jgi:uncharacterized protein (DUF1697 family)